MSAPDPRFNRQYADPARGHPAVVATGARLLRDGGVPPDDLIRALAIAARSEGRLANVLGRPPGAGVAAALADLTLPPGLRRIDPLANLPDPRLIDRLGAVTCLRDRCLPWRMVGGRTVIAVPESAVFMALRPALQAVFGPVSMTIAPAAAIEAAVLARRGPALARAAETCVSPAESCRNWDAATLAPRAALAASLLLALLWFQPLALWMALLGLALTTLAATLLLKVAAALAACRTPPQPPDAAAAGAELPVVSVIVALYRESDIAARLVQRLSRLSYPRDRFEVLLAVEAEDCMTRDALARAALPAWMRVVVVPDGPVKTKPRALNHALKLCRGRLVGVYDAEDAPQPDQILQIARRFQTCGPRVACLQGVLDFYNPRTNWLARCFTMDYAIWFRMILPGIARLGLVVPLGGTTLFFRRDVLEQLGGWDAHNVTEDADLGLRLARHGWRTELVATTTMEEANCRAIPWVKQRSRWIKGYMMTWAVHMRAPRRLWRELGPARFLGVQALFFGSLCQFLLAPLLWSLWAGPLGLPHPLLDALPGWALAGMGGFFLCSEGAAFAIGVLALRRTGHGLSPLWLFTLTAYYPLATLAAYKAAWEMITRPFYWDKTSHGLFDGAASGG